MNAFWERSLFEDPILQIMIFIKKTHTIVRSLLVSSSLIGLKVMSSDPDLPQKVGKF